MGNYPQDSDPLRSAHEAIVVGDLERAIAILRSSLESDLAIDPAIRVRAKLALADALRQTGRLMEAATSVDQALASALHDLGKGSPLYALALSDTGVQRHFENDLASARDFYERAIAAYEDMEYPPAAAFATSLANLGTILSRHFQEFGEAEECLKRSLLLCDTLPNSDVLRDDLEGSLADFYNEIGNHRAAADIIEHVLDRRRRLFTTPNGAVAKTLLALGHQYAALGRLADATNVLTEARAVYAQVIAPSDIRYGSACRELASVHQSLGNHHQALNLHIEAEESFLPALGPKHPWTLRNRLGKAHSLHMLGQHDKSAEMIKKVISGFRDEYGETSRDYAQVLHEYGTLLARQGSSDQAASLLRAAREIRATLLGVNSFDYAVTLNSEASVHSALGRTAEAVSLLTQAVQIFERLDTTNHITYSTVLANLAIELGRSQDYEAAQSAMAKAAAIDDAIVRRAYLLGRRHARIGLAERIRANVVVAIGLAACSTDRAGSLVEAAATFVLRYKGIEYELESSLNETLTQTLREHDRQALERLRQLETDIAAAESSDSLNTAASTDLHSLRMQADRLSMQIWSAVGNESSISLTQKVTAHDLQSALEYRDGVLEYAVYVPITTAANAA